MDLDKKKKLSTQVMGWEVVPNTLLFFRDENQEGVRIDNWNPQDNDTQFIEVIRALSPHQKNELLSLLMKTEGFNNKFSADNRHVWLFDSWLWLIDNKDKVLDAILEVVNND